jgi:hypothetical protein
MDLVTTTVNRDLSQGIPALTRMINLIDHLIDNPLSVFVNITDIIKDIETMRSLLVSTDTDTQQILRDISDIVESVIRLLTSMLPKPRV